MTHAEEKQIQYLNQQLAEIRNENGIYKLQLSELVSQINKKVDAKHSPIYLENDILATCQTAIQAAMKSCLEGYNSPLTKLIHSVVESHSLELRELISSSFEQVIRLQDFKDSIVTAFSHKVAKSIISNNDGLFDKVANELKQDAIFKSKMSIAVSNVVEECLKSRN